MNLIEFLNGAGRKAHRPAIRRVRSRCRRRVQFRHWSVRSTGLQWRRPAAFLCVLNGRRQLRRVHNRRPGPRRRHRTRRPKRPPINRPRSHWRGSRPPSTKLTWRRRNPRWWISAESVKRSTATLPFPALQCHLAAPKGEFKFEFNSSNWKDLTCCWPPFLNRNEDELSLVTSNTPYSRLSLASCASRNSSEAYIGVNDLASSPEAANRSRDADEVRSYMDLQPPLEAEEMYMSSHFADEPLYQFYTAAIIEVNVL